MANGKKDGGRSDTRVERDKKKNKSRMEEEKAKAYGDKPERESKRLINRSIDV